jgi:hypothetical protein
MRATMKLAAAGACALAVAYATAASADPYYYRNNNGSWTNTQYNDGGCQIYYSHNAYDGETYVNRYGNCANVGVGPNGAVLPVVPGPVLVYPPPY